MHWRLGQALLPAHLERAEEASARALALRFAQLGPAPWGIGDVRWDEVMLARGIVRLEQLFVLMPRGRLVHVPGNASAAPLDLGAAETSEATVWLHLLRDPGYEREDPRASDLEAVELAVDRVELTLSPAHPGAVDALALARVELGPDGTWRVSPRYVPPLLSLAAWPAAFAALLARVRRILAAWEDLLLGDLDAHVLSTGKALRAHECLRRSRLCAWFFTQLDAAAPARGVGTAAAPLDVHPFEIYRRLVDLHLDVHGYHSAAADVPALAARVYDHADLVGSFEPLLADLEDRTRLPHGRAPYAPFLRDGRVFAVALPERAETYRLYWLVRRADGVARDALRSVILAAPGRLEIVHRHALRGVAARALPRVPFRHDFDPDVEFFELVAEGDEWPYALQERRIAFLAEGPVTRCDSYLFWRGG